MDFEACKSWLAGLPEPKSWDLDRMRAMAQDAGLQAEKIKAVQVAGTNGKGSTCAFLEAILRHAGRRSGKSGLKTGLYTSPHLLDVRERIRINGRVVSEPRFAALAVWARPFVEKHGASYFESLTLMAFKHFSDHAVDWAVVEVGLGGRKDATSIIRPKISIITNIALEHTEQLGGTIEKIAEEKAGIIPPDGTVLTAAEGKALEVIRSAAIRKKAKLEAVPPLEIVRRFPLTVRLILQDVPLALQGTHQAQNAALAVAAAKELQSQGVDIADADIMAGLRSAIWPGRLQTIGNVVIDGAHNPDGIRTLVQALQAAHPGQRWNLIFGVLSDKDYPEMVRRICQLPLESVQVLTPKSPRALAGEKLAPLFEKQGKKATKAADVHYALDRLHGKPAMVCGSLYLAAEALGQLRTRGKKSGS